MSEATGLNVILIVYTFWYFIKCKDTTEPLFAYNFCPLYPVVGIRNLDKEKWISDNNLVLNLWQYSSWGYQTSQLVLFIIARWLQDQIMVLPLGFVKLRSWVDSVPHLIHLGKYSSGSAIKLTRDHIFINHALQFPTRVLCLILSFLRSPWLVVRFYLCDLEDMDPISDDDWSPSLY